MHEKLDEAKRKEREANKKRTDAMRIIADNNKTLDEAIANNNKKLERTILAERECTACRIACINDANKLYFDGMAQRIWELETICKQQRIELKSNQIDQRRDIFELKNNFVSQKRSFLQTFSKAINSVSSNGQDWTWIKAEAEALKAKMHSQAQLIVDLRKEIELKDNMIGKL